MARTPYIERHGPYEVQRNQVACEVVNEEG